MIRNQTRASSCRRIVLRVARTVGCCASRALVIVVVVVVVIVVDFGVSMCVDIDVARSSATTTLATNFGIALLCRVRRLINVEQFE